MSRSMYKTDRTIKYNHEYDIEIYYNAVSDVYVLRDGGRETFYDYKYQAMDAYYDALADADDSPEIIRGNDY